MPCWLGHIGLVIHGKIVLFTNSDTKNITDVCNVAPKLIESGQEGQGEAVAYRYNKPGIVHVSEGYAAKLFNIDCKE